MVHRLNRAEYGNAIRDLLALDVDVTELLPSDGANFGFDNIAASLSTSPLLLERYLTAAQRISAHGGRRSGRARPGRSSIRSAANSARTGTSTACRSGHAAARWSVMCFRPTANTSCSGGWSGESRKATPASRATTCRTPSSSRLTARRCIRRRSAASKDHEVQAKDMNEARTLDRRAHDRPCHRDRRSARRRLHAGRERPSQPQDVWQPALRDSQEVHMIGGLPRLKTVGIEGPYSVTGVSATPSRDRIFVCQPAGGRRRSSPCATRILTNLARRAYRRPVTAADVEAPMAFYKQARESGGNFDAGIRAGVARILASPSFLYRIERDPAGLRAGTAHAVSDVELASRLSFFLWSSIPDETLLNLATAGRLREPGVLAAQVRRMIADERADALVSNFAGQWLQLRNLEAKVAPDLLMFPDFDDNIREAFRRETELLFAPHHAREPQRARAAERRLHVRQRAARQALRHPGCLRRALPPGEADRSQPARPARTREHPVADLGRDQNLAGVSRQVHPEHVPEHAAAAAAAERPDARGKQPRARRPRRRRCASSSSCTGATRPAPPVIASSTRRALRSRTSIRSGSGATPMPMARRSTPRACWRTVPRWMVPLRCATPS